MSLLWHKVSSLAYEQLFGINTRGLLAPTVEGGVHYTPLPYRVVFDILKRMELKPSDVLVDLGSGKGRVLCCAARMDLKKVVGIEVNPVLNVDARQNLSNLRGRRTPVEILEMLAQDYSYDGVTAIYMYNPFDRPIMEMAMNRVQESYRRAPRPFKIAYANCLHEEPLKKLGWLKKLEEWPVEDYPGFSRGISFWST
jgi:hypothetical protein